MHVPARTHTHTKKKCSCAHEITFLGGTNKCQVRVVGNLECVQFRTGWLTHVYTVQGGTHLPSKHQNISARWHWWQRGGLECAPWWGWIGNLLGSEAKKGFLIKLPSQCLTVLITSQSTWILGGDRKCRMNSGTCCIFLYCWLRVSSIQLQERMSDQNRLGWNQQWVLGHCSLWRTLPES